MCMYALVSNVIFNVFLYDFLLCIVIVLQTEFFKNEIYEQEKLSGQSEEKITFFCHFSVSEKVESKKKRKEKKKGGFFFSVGLCLLIILNKY